MCPRGRRTVGRRLALVLFATVTAATFSPRRAWTHPLHTTLAELSFAPGGGVRIVLRAFVDDFSAAVAGVPAGHAGSDATPTDSAAARYLDATIGLTDGAGRRVPLRVELVRRAGDLLWVTLRAPSVRSSEGVRLTNRVLFERWADQVNIVQTSVAGRRQTLLFTRRDGGSGRPI